MVIRPWTTACLRKTTLKRLHSYRVHKNQSLSEVLDGILDELEKLRAKEADRPAENRSETATEKNENLV